MRWIPEMVIVMLLVIGRADGRQEATASAEEPSSQPADLEALGEEAATVSLSLYLYVVPDGDNYLQPTISWDQDWLHLEARYSYEDQDTASVWAGTNFSVGEDLTFDITPMLGVVFGETDGIAPGYEFSLGWRGFELYSEGEYVFDLNDSSDNFFYTWSELTYSPIEWFRAGLVVQRTKAYESDFDIQRGFLIGATYENLDVAVYVLNPGDDDQTVVVGFRVEF